jgi:hypothetical protein
MRIFSFVLMGLGILLLVNIGYDEYRGITHEPSSRYTGYFHDTITRQAKPEEFHNAMLVYLSQSFLFLLAGFVLFMIDRGQEKVDPMSTDSDENIDEELREDELDEKKE